MTNIGYTINTSNQIEISVSEFLNTESAVSITIDFSKIVKGHIIGTYTDDNTLYDLFFDDMLDYKYYLIHQGESSVSSNDVPYGMSLTLNPVLFQ